MASFALLSWPAVALALFALLGPARGLIWATMIGYLFLPDSFGFKLAGLPDYSKYSAIALSGFLGVVIFGATQRPEGPPLRAGWAGPLQYLLLACLFIGPLFTVLGNMAPVNIGGAVRPALTIKDFVSMVGESAIAFAPFFLARHWLGSERMLREVLIAMTALGLVYSVLVLFEWRMSPQLNNWVYGYFPHSWLQHLRGGGFRPIVFLSHGLWVGLFMFTVVIAAGALSRLRERPFKPLILPITGWLLLVLLMSYNLGAALIALMLLPVVLLLTPRMQAWIAMGIAVVFLSFPALRQAQMVPMDKILSYASRISENRAASLAFRVENEDLILARAVQRPLYGWGGWSRWRVFNDKGRDVGVSDGLWLIILGERGWLGYLGFFGTLTMPVLLLPFVARRKRITTASTGLAVMTVGNLIYLIPNSALNPIGFLAAGALAGYVLRPAEDAAPETTEAADAASRKRGYSRFPADGVTPPSAPTAPRRTYSRSPQAETSRPYSRPSSATRGR